jgi:hypothetical protein
MPRHSVSEIPTVWMKGQMPKRRKAMSAGAT